MTIRQDTFDRADSGSPGTTSDASFAWVELTDGASITTNYLTLLGWGYGHAYYTYLEGDTDFAPTQFVQAECWNGGGGFGIACRANGAGTGYLFRHDPGANWFYLDRDGVNIANLSGFAFGGWTNGDVAKVSCVIDSGTGDATVKVYKNGVEKMSVVDDVADVPAGLRPQLIGFSTVIYENFYSEDVPAVDEEPEYEYGDSPATVQQGAGAQDFGPTLVAGDAADEFSVTPTPPAWLTFNTVDGHFTFTPGTGMTSDVTYTVTPTNIIGDGPTTTFRLIITNPAAPTISYADSPAEEVVGVATSFLATLTGFEAVVTVSPTLPAGLLIDSETGDWSGTATDYECLKLYRVTATNDGGSDYFDFTMEIVYKYTEEIDGIPTVVTVHKTCGGGLLMLLLGGGHAKPQYYRLIPVKPKRRRR